MKLLITALALIIGFHAPAFAANEECTTQKETVSCLITFKNAKQEIKNQEISFEVQESSFLCDGQPNKYFHAEYSMSPKYVAWVYSDWNSLDLAIFDKKDTHRRDAIAIARAPRILSKNRSIQPYQSLSAELPRGEFGQIMCEPAN